MGHSGEVHIGTYIPGPFSFSLRVNGELNEIVRGFNWDSFITLLL